MLFHLTTEDHIRTTNEPEPADADAGGGSFASERELQELASAWPMKRLVEIWNRLPGVEPVARFTDHKIAIRRIWRAIQPHAEKGGIGGVCPLARVQNIIAWNRIERFRSRHTRNANLGAVVLTDYV